MSQKRKVKFYEGNGSPIISSHQNRNDPCQCGSGKKAKKCCGTVTKYYHLKPKPNENPVDQAS